VIAGREIPASTRIVTYVSRGSSRCAASTSSCVPPGSSPANIPTSCSSSSAATGSATGATRSTFATPPSASTCLPALNYDLSKFLFTGLVSVATLVDILSLSDLHVYLTVPFVLSWSLMDALACGCTVLASRTAPVVEMIATAKTACWSTSSTLEGLARRAVEVLRDPRAFHSLGQRGAELVRGGTRWV